MHKVERRSFVGDPVAITNSVNTSPRVPYGPCSGGLMFVTAASGNAASVSWYASHAPEGDKLPVIDSTGAQVTTAVQAGKAYPIPAELFGAPFICAVTDAGAITVIFTSKG